MIEVPINARVECTDGEVGLSTHVIIDPTKNTVTHFVVSDEEGIGEQSRLVPVDSVVATTRELIRLKCTMAEFENFEPFMALHYLKADRGEVSYSADAIYLAPYVTPLRTDYVAMEVENIPAGEIAYRRGAVIEATDGYVGRLGEFLVDADSGAITHFVLEEGGPFSKKEVSLPLSAVDHSVEDTIFLNIDKKSVEQLPAIPVQRHYDKPGEPGDLELMAKIFDGEEKAAEALKALKKQKNFELRNAAVLVKDREGKSTIKETEDVDPKQGRIFGAITGGLIGLLGGPVGVVIGALAGAGTGGLAAKWIDMGFSDAFLNKFQELLEPGSSALIVLVENRWAQPLSEAMSGLDGVMMRHSLTDKMLEMMEKDEENPAASSDKDSANIDNDAQ